MSSGVGVDQKNFPQGNWHYRGEGLIALPSFMTFKGVVSTKEVEIIVDVKGEADLELFSLLLQLCQGEGL